MIAADPNEALVEFLNIVNRFIGCVTQAPLILQPTDSDAYVVLFSRGQPVQLQTSPGYAPLQLSIVHHCRPVRHPRIADAYTIAPEYYSYEILDSQGSEVLTYHWHPAGMSSVKVPHLHLSSRIDSVATGSTAYSQPEIRLSELHIPTGRIRLEDLVRFLIEDLNVVPIPSDWNERLIGSSEL